MTQIGQAQQNANAISSEAKAVATIQDPTLYASAGDDVKEILANPTPRVVAAIQHSKPLVKNFAALNHQAQQDLVNQVFSDKFAGRSPSVTVDLNQAKAAGITPDLGKLQQITGGFAKQLASLGPGLVKVLGEDLPIETYNLIAHPGSKGANMHPLTADVNAMLGNVAESVQHPVRQWQQDPTSLIENLAAIPFTAAGAAARASELGRAGELARAAGISKAQQVGKTLLRPQSVERELNLGGPGGLTLTPPAYKSALGGYLQKFLDPRLTEGVLNPPPTARLGQRIAGKFGLDSTGIAAANRLGRKARLDMENEIRIKQGGLQTRMPPEDAASLARGTTFYDRWRALHNSGVHHTQIDDFRKWVGLRKPPEGVQTDPSLVTPKNLKSHPFLHMSDQNLAQQFTAGKGSRMIASEKEIAANPDNYTYLPKSLIDSMKTYEASPGPESKVLKTMDIGTQAIRSGRFMSPSYFQWAIQNGLIGAAQQGAFMGRNWRRLGREFPKLTPEEQGMFDGATGKGIAFSTAGGPSAAKSIFGRGKIVKGLQGKWHVINDEWARRMAGIHELGAEGYHTAASWKKLMKNDPAKFRRIVGGQGSREAINYAEMTPSERATLQKMMTAYGWTRGASTYAARFPLQHPVQAAVGLKAANVGQQYVEDYYKKHGGLPPEYLLESLPMEAGHRLGLPIGANWLMPTSMIAPTGTLGNILSELPGATYAQTENLLGEAAPVPNAALALLSGQTKYGSTYKGQERLTGPLKDLAGSFKPWSAIQSMVPAFQKPGGTYAKGPVESALRFGGVPLEKLRNPTTTAGLGEKDFEMALPTVERIKFQLQQKLDRLPGEEALYKKLTGNNLPPAVLSKLKADYDAVEQRDLFQHSYAAQHHAKTWKALPPVTKLAGTLDWMAHHGYNHAQIAAAQATGSHLTGDKDMETLVNALWQGTGIGQVESQWQSAVKGMKPPVLTPAGG
jgi:hypothetical protein